MWIYCVRAKSVNPVNEMISSDRCNSATEIQNIRVWSLHSCCLWSSAAFPYLLLQSLDHPCVCFWWPKAASLISFIFRRNRVGNNSLPENHLALRPSKYNHVLNLLILWFFFLYMESLFSYWTLWGSGCCAIFWSSHWRTVLQVFDHFLFTTRRRVLGFDPVTTQDVLKLAHTFIYFRVDYCEPCQTSCSDTEGFTTVNTARAEIYSIISFSSHFLNWFLALCDDICPSCN